MKALTTILAVLALGTFVVNAADEKPKAKMTPEEAFKKKDGNGDGKVSKEEFLASPQAKKDAAKAEERFGKMDKDKDGSLTVEEMTPKKKK